MSRDLSQAHFATGIAGRLQQVLDDWNFLSPQLEDLYATLNGGKARHAFAHDARLCMAPLPRAPHYVACEPAFNDNAAAAPMVHVGSGDAFSGPTDALFNPAEEVATCHAGVAAITADVPPARRRRRRWRPFGCSRWSRTGRCGA